MTRLTATLSAKLSSHILLRGAQTRRYEAVMDGFDVEVTLHPDPDGPRSRRRRQRNWTATSKEVSVAVSRDEAVPPPPLIVLPSGGRDFRNRVPYMDQRSREYGPVAFRALNNAVAFLRFQLRQPLQKIQASALNWTDDLGHDIETGIVITAPATFLTHPDGYLGVQPLERKHDKRLGAAIAKPVSVALHEELLSDAQAAAMQGNIRRAVLELAIACEVFAKHAFFGSDDAGRVFAALEDRGKLGVSIIDLIEIGGEALRGTKFRKFDPAAHADIDHLFRARNKVAHRGEVTFRDDKGKQHTVDRALLERWWRSVEKLFAWAD